MAKAKKMLDGEQEEIRKLYRSKQDKMIAGVCGGIAEYFKLDSVWIRLIMILLAILNGIGIIIYIIMWILLKENPNQSSSGKTLSEKKRRSNN